ncbi:MAG: ornithine cyclodeaminase [Planctomycetia bacterium]|nr:ornithine cyclodeaminase [Planctomycetia bacterium]
MLILNADEVRRALPMPQAIDAMKQAFAAYSGGRAVVPARTHLSVPQHAGVSLIMPSFVSDAEAQLEALAVKVVSVFDNNAERVLARIQAAVLVIDPATGQPQALVEGAALTAIRTAAASGAATDQLARRDAHVVAILGSGVQARTHFEAVCAIRPISEIRVYSRTPSQVEKLIGELAVQTGGKVCLVAASSARQAVYNADVICATTTSSTAVFDDIHVAPGTHINAVGSYTPQAREVPAETVVRSRVVVDSRHAAWDEAGDLIQPLNAGLIGREHIHAELGEIVLGQKSGRADDREITLFKSVGLAVQDAVAARCALENAHNLRLGCEIPW